LWASDIAASKTLVASYPSINQSDIHNPRLAPDGKIYITSVGDLKSLHIIHSPNKKGTDCRFESRGVDLLTYTSLAMPIFPNYRVGPVDNSSCDTLGLDNHPLARFTWEQEDVSEPMRVTFTDISEYEPDTWHWGFGDGTVSQDTSPVHLYAQPGIYEVCLVVVNDYSSDTLCRWLNMDVSSIKERETTPFEIAVLPNPFSSHLRFKGFDYLRGQVGIYDITCRQLATKSWSGGQLDGDWGDLPSGVYFYKIHTDKGFSQVGKIIKQ
jgi:PKD domain